MASHGFVVVSVWHTDGSAACMIDSKGEIDSSYEIISGSTDPRIADRSDVKYALIGQFNNKFGEIFVADTLRILIYGSPDKYQTQVDISADLTCLDPKKRGEASKGIADIAFEAGANLEAPQGVPYTPDGFQFGAEGLPYTILARGIREASPEVLVRAMVGGHDPHSIYRAGMRFDSIAGYYLD